jgi:hypothetical protein
VRFADRRLEDGYPKWRAANLPFEQCHSITIDCNRWLTVSWVSLSTPRYSRYSRYSPYSHSMIFIRSKLLNFRRKCFLRTTKNRPADPSETCALDFKHEFHRFAICSVSATIDNDRSIFGNYVIGAPHAQRQKRPSVSPVPVLSLRGAVG